MRRGPLDRAGHPRVEPGAVVLFSDNDVHGSNHPILRTDEDGNTFQRRTLSDGTDWEVLENFPDRHREWNVVVLARTLNGGGRCLLHAVRPATEWLVQRRSSPVLLLRITR